MRHVLAILTAAVVLLAVAVDEARTSPNARYPHIRAAKHLTPAVVAYWQRLHQCEQPSGWHGGYPRYPGGLGILAANWTAAARELGMLARYPDGGKAPPLVQIRVAELGYRRWRWWWGCFSVVGYPPR